MSAIKDDPFGLVGQVLDGQFRIDEVVAEGGSSVVYRGEHVALEAKVAIKCLKLQSQLGSSLVESFLRRFRDEGRTAYKLSQGHFHIVRCLAIGTTIAPRSSTLVPYTVLEWLEGHALARQFEERRLAAGQGRPLADLLKLLDSAADAVGYAHAQGIAHRDLNPGSIFLAQTRDGVQAKVLDFGLAQIVGDHAIETQAAEPRSAPAAASFRVFSPAYAAPEQLDPSLGAPGPWTDVYALAMVLLEGMRDQPPYLGLSMEELKSKILDPEARPTPRNTGVVVSDEVQAIFARALALHPPDRTQDVGEFWSALKAATGSLPQVDAAQPLPDATVRMDALNFDDLGAYDDAPARDDAPTRRDVRSEPPMPQDMRQDEKSLMDEETTIDEKLEPDLPLVSDFPRPLPAGEPPKPVPEASGVHATTSADQAPAGESAEASAPRPKMSSADFTGGHRAMSPESTGPRKGLPAQETPPAVEKQARGPVVLAVLLGAGAALVALAALSSLYLKDLQLGQRHGSEPLRPLPAVSNNGRTESVPSADATSVVESTSAMVNPTSAPLPTGVTTAAPPASGPRSKPPPHVHAPPKSTAPKPIITPSPTSDEPKELPPHDPESN